MSEKSFRIFAFCFAVFLAAHLTAVSQKQDSIDIPTLLNEAEHKSGENWLAMIRSYGNYTYKWRKIWRDADKNGKIREESELYEITIPAKCPAEKCYSESVLLEKNGKATAPEKIEKERMKAGRRLEKTESGGERLLPTGNLKLQWMRFASFIRRLPDNETGVLIDGQEILEKADFFAPTREVINGREAIGLSFRPRLDATFPIETNYTPKIEGKIWIDAADKVFIRLAMWEEGKQFENQTSDYLLENAALALDLTRTNEGLWLHRLGRIGGLSNPTLFANMKSNFSLENFDYHFIKTEVKDFKINSPTERKQ